MFRKSLAVIVSAVVMLSLFPAFALAVETSGSLDSARELLPGDDQRFQLTIENEESGLLNTTSANWARVILPANLSAATCETVPVGWTCSGGNDRVTLSGGVLTPGQALTFSFLADVATPFDRDRNAALDVRISENNGVTNLRVPGDFSIVTRALEVVPSSLRITAPAGALDGTATEGQTVTLQGQVRSYARQPIPVTATVSSQSGSFELNTTAAAGTVSAFSLNVPLRTIGNSTTAAETFTFDVDGSGVDSLGNATLPFTIEHRQLLALDADSFSNPVVRNNEPITYDFAIDASKLHLPGVSGLSGQLSFAGTTAALENSSLTRGQGTQRLTFAGTTVTAPGGSHDVTFNFSGTDDNGAPFVQEIVLADLITVDNLAPEITVELAGPAGQPQVKDGDTITVSGDVTAGDAVDFVNLKAADGTTYPVQVTVNGGSFSGTIQLDTDGAAYPVLTAEAQASDLAGNTGFARSVGSLQVDNVIPTINDPARIVDGALVNRTGKVVEVAINERFLVAGGCAPSAWTMDQNRVVTDVLYSNGQRCTAEQAGPDNTRYLVVSGVEELDQDVSYQVTYNADWNPLGMSDNLLDGARNKVIDSVVNTVSGIAPALADLAGITRNNNTETMVFEDGVYWTRFAGADGLATIRNTRAGYFIEVTDQNNNVLAVASADGENGTINVPIGGTDGAYVRGFRLVNASGLRGEIAQVTIILDRVAPEAVSSAPANGGTDVVVNFSEVLYDGSNRALDWHARERNNDPAERPYFRYEPEVVSGSGTSRVLENIRLGNNGSYLGAYYAFDAEVEGDRYEDYAGNELQDILP